jgi:hypothetical protein
MNASDLSPFLTVFDFCWFEKGQKLSKTLMKLSQKFMQTVMNG